MSGALRVLVLLTADQVRRLLRVGTVVRSLVFPGTLAILAVLGTVAVVIGLRPPGRLAVTSDVAASAWVAEVREGGFELLITDDPGAAVRREEATLGTDGLTLWVGQGGAAPPALEGTVRQHLGAAWRPEHPRRAGPVRAAPHSDAPRQLAVLIGALFTLYGVVFGAGSVARDRDEGTLDAELSLAVPHALHGLARWLAGTLVLSAAYGISIAFFHALMGMADPVGLALHGLAAAGGATAIGLLVVGRAGLDKGFAGSLSGGLVVAVMLLSAGVAQRELAGWIPIASLLARDASPAAPLVVAGLAGALSGVVFARRTAVS